jgi:alkaline phosphatase
LHFSYPAHVLWRDYENDIAEQQIGDVPGMESVRHADLLLGGGRRHFVPRSNPESIREDDRDLLAEAKGRGFQVLVNLNDYNALFHNTSRNAPPELPILGLFTPDVRFQPVHSLQRMRYRC